MEEPKKQNFSDLFPNAEIKPAAAVGLVIANALRSIFDSEYMRKKLEDEAKRAIGRYEAEGKIDEAKAVHAFIRELKVERE